MNITTKIFVMSAVLISVILPSENAEQEVTGEMKFSMKGHVSKTSFIQPGMTVWTAIKGNNATFIFHGVSGLEVIKFALSQNEICNSTQTQMCFNGNITKARDPDQAFSEGGQARIIITPNDKKETIGFLSGVLKDTVFQIDLTEVRMSRS